MQAGSQKAIGFVLVHVTDFPSQICLPAAITRNTVGQTICGTIDGKSISFQELEESESVFVA